MSIQFYCAIGCPYEYGNDREYLPFDVHYCLDLGYIGDGASHLYRLYNETSKGDNDYRKVALDVPLNLSDDALTHDSHRRPLRMLPVEVVLKVLRRDLRRYPHYEMAINAIEIHQKHYDNTFVVLYMSA